MHARIKKITSGGSRTQMGSNCYSVGIHASISKETYGHRSGSRIAGKGNKSVGVRFAYFITLFLKQPMEMKSFRLIIGTKLFHFHRIFRNGWGGGGGSQENPCTLSGSATAPLVIFQGGGGGGGVSAPHVLSSGFAHQVNFRHCCSSCVLLQRGSFTSAHALLHLLNDLWTLA